jgi:hypothetical protein
MYNVLSHSQAKCKLYVLTDSRLGCKELRYGRSGPIKLTNGRVANFLIKGLKNFLKEGGFQSRKSG